MSINDLKLKTW